MNNPKEIQTKIEQLRKEIAGVNTNSGWDSAANISKKQSEIFVLASQLAEISTRRIIHLTWALAFLTFALLIFTAWPVIFPKDFDFKVKCAQEKKTNNQAGCNTVIITKRN
jgi:hypothetical protein